MNSMNFMNCRRLRTKCVEERKWKRQNGSGREAYKDVRPAPLDVRQRGTPKLGFSFAEDVPLREPIPSLSERKEWAARPQGGWGIGGRGLVMPDAKFYEQCLLLSHLSWRRRLAPFSIVFLLWPSCPFFYLLFFLPLILPFPFCLCTFCGRAEFLFSRKSYGSLANASASANASAPLILRERAKGGILARSQMFPREQEEQRELISSSSRV